MPSMEARGTPASVRVDERSDACDRSMMAVVVRIKVSTAAVFCLRNADLQLSFFPSDPPCNLTLPLSMTRLSSSSGESEVACPCPNWTNSSYCRTAGVRMLVTWWCATV